MMRDRVDRKYSHGGVPLEWRYPVDRVNNPGWAAVDNVIHTGDRSRNGSVEGGLVSL